MKKKILFLLVCILTGLTLHAVPRGVYCDSRGRQKVVVNGNEISCLDNNGYVRSRWMVVDEDSNGRFQIQVIVDGRPVGNKTSGNAWWKENGKTYLNLANQSGTLVLE